MKYIDDFLNYITMYRLVLYILIVFVGYAVILSFFGLLPFSPYALLFSAAFLLFIGWATNAVFAAVFETPANVESFYISALILALIIAPINSVSDLSFLFWAAVLTMASKFIIALHKKHIFNPVAFAVFITSLTIYQSANWWVGTAYMLPVVASGGFLIIRKIRRFDLFGSFALSSLVTITVMNLTRGISIPITLEKVILNSPWVFFGTVMLTEPLTTPPTNDLRLYYGAMVGFLFAPQVHLGNIYSTPEGALLLGNIFSYIVSPKEKLLLTLEEKIRIAPDIYDFMFSITKPVHHQPGQYMEWTVGHTNPDNRGNRRYFTIASSPTENNVRLGVRFNDPSSSFKKSLLAMTGGAKVLAGQLAGDFTLPRDPAQKLAFIAGGIGVTPFRSIVKYLVDKKETRSIVLLFTNKSVSEIVYKDVFDEAARTIGMKTVYSLTDTTKIPREWLGHVGRMDASTIQAEIPDFKERLFYISGPNALVTAYESVLHSMGIAADHIKTDFFPGFV